MRRLSNAQRLRADAGLTMMEMIVVLAIIGIVAAIVVPNVIGRPDQARATVAQADLRTMTSALRMYRLDNGSYPTTDQGLSALSARPEGAANWAEDGYLSSLPSDPWGRPYVYRSPGQSGRGFDLMSHGRDGRPGGEGLDADLTAQAN